MNPESKLDVFISYNTADEVITKKVVEYLERQKHRGTNIQVFFAPWDIKPADNFIERINEGLAKAKFFALVLSPEALQAEWPTAERAASLLSDPSGRMGRVIPILVKPCRIPPLLAIRSWIDLRDASKFKTEMQKMLCTVKEEPLPRGEIPLGAKIVVESKAATSLTTNQASEPDKIDESLHTNLFSVTKLPSVIWRASTEFCSKGEVYRQIGGELPPFILRENHLFTLSNLNVSANRLGFAVDTHTIKSTNVNEWFNDENKSRWLIELLTSEAHKFCRNRGLYFDKTGKRFYGDKRVVTGEKFSWIAHVRIGRRGLIIPYTKPNRETGEMVTYFYRHRAVGLRFQILGNELFLQIDPGWVFSKDGSILIQGEKRGVLNTKLKSRIKNDAVFVEMRFWAWILSDGAKITMGFDSATIEVDSKPLSFKTTFGVYGDHKPIPNTIKEPPPLVDEEDSESISAYEEMYEGVKENSHDV